jgi:hypothetical protein
MHGPWHALAPYTTEPLSCLRHVTSDVAQGLRHSLAPDVSAPPRAAAFAPATVASARACCCVPGPDAPARLCASAPATADFARIAVSQGLRHARDIASAIEYLHDSAIPAHCVLHRDLKPDNVVFTEGGVLKVRGRVGVRAERLLL